MAKDNKALAEFMGVGHLYEAQSSNQWNQYHISWKALMPVIHRMRDIEFDHEPLCNVSLYSNIDEVYKEVVEAVKWYRVNKRMNEQLDSIIGKKPTS
jgi:hypothetical protein